MQIIRLIIGGLLAVVVTVVLLGVMQQLIHQDEINIDEGETRKIADIQMGKTDIEVNVSERKPDRPEDPEELPPEIEQPELQNLDVNAEQVNIAPSLKVDLSLLSGPGLSASDGEYLPMVKVQPQYPSRALSRGIEGYCIVEYTVTKTGSVRDPVAVADECKPLFKSASVKAALRFKYKPRIENGEPIEVPGVRNKFTYKLAK